MMVGSGILLFPNPAAVYVWPDLEFVATNDAGRRLAAKLPERGDDDPQMSWIALSDEEVRAGVEADPNNHLVCETEWGLIQFSLLEPHPEYHPRPTLLLTSVSNRTLALARIDHERMAYALQMHEAAQAQTSLLETTMQQLAAAARVQDEMLKRFNEYVGWVTEIDPSGT